VTVQPARTGPAHRRAPRPLALALERLGADLVPATSLARVQACWGSVVGEAIAAVARPTAEHGGTLTVTCTSAVWAQELDLMAMTLLEQLNSALGAQSPHALRCRVG
jgi:predicted nucleic acid-binding Zn ribbon protein